MMASFSRLRYRDTVFRVGLLTFCVSALLAYGDEVSSVSSGAYTGSFDPPTIAHENIIRDALSQYKLNKLYVFVNASGGKNFKSSIDERIGMLRAGLADVADRIEFQPMLQEEKTEVVKHLAHSSKGTFFRFIGEDSYAKVPAEVDLSNSHEKWVIFARPDERSDGKANIQPSQMSVEFRTAPVSDGISSTNARELLQAGKSTEGILSRDVASYIQKHALYQSYPKDLIELQSSLHEQAFRQFVSELKVVKPDLNLDSIPLPPFEPTQSQLARAELFARWVVEQKGLSGQARRDFEEMAEPLLFGTFGQKRVAKIPYLSHLTPRIGLNQRVEIISEKMTRIHLPRESFQPHTLDIPSYVAQRFPVGLQALIRKKNIPIYLHDGTSEESLGFHQSQGFRDIYQVLIGQGNVDRQAVLMRNPDTGALRFVWPSINSHDQFVRSKEQLALAVGPRKVHQVHHKKPSPLIQWNESGKSLSLGPSDEVIIGFANHLRAKYAKSENWKTETLASNGADLHLYTHLSSGRRILGVSNVYGDETSEILRILYSRGARRFTMLGTAGSLDKSIHIGDLVIPKVLIEPSGKTVQIDNKASELLHDQSITAPVHSDSRHGWVQSILQESEPKVKQMQASGVQSLDIEGRYLFQFLRTHPDVRGGVAYIISDEPLGAHDYADMKGAMFKVHQTLDQVLPHFIESDFVHSGVSQCIENHLQGLAH